MKQTECRCTSASISRHERQQYVPASTAASTVLFDSQTSAVQSHTHSLSAIFLFFETRSFSILLAGSTFLFRLATALIPELAPFKDSLMLSLIKSQQDVAWAQLNTDTRLATFDNEERLAWEPQFRQLNDLTDSFGNIVPDG